VQLFSLSNVYPSEHFSHIGLILLLDNLQEEQLSPQLTQDFNEFNKYPYLQDLHSTDFVILLYVQFEQFGGHSTQLFESS
jgi:hypothetical protein